jgi:hypothetical protein
MTTTAYLYLVITTCNICMCMRAITVQIISRLFRGNGRMTAHLIRRPVDNALRCVRMDNGEPTRDRLLR